MATHRISHTLTSPEGTMQDLAAGSVKTGDTSVAVGDDITPCVVSANGGADNVVDVAIDAASIKSLVFLADVPCVATLTGATVIDGITAGTVTLEAGVMRQVLAITGDMTSLSVGPNTTSAGAAGTIKIRALYNS
jgi:hypothetical protein